MKRYREVVHVEVGDLFDNHDPDDFRCRPFVVGGYDHVRFLDHPQKRSYLVLNAEDGLTQFSDKSGKYTYEGLLKFINKNRMRKLGNVCRDIRVAYAGLLSEGRTKGT